jgi:predicted dehydrogenase/threonine dehydrogenase-like Zn-dependent dehydrogenase
VKQIVQSFKTGKLEFIDVPAPICMPNGILVRTVFSLISIGTEKLMIDLAKKSLIGKAKERPDQVKQVVDKVKKEGLKQTYKKVLNKLEDPKPLGYSCSGKVIEVGTNGGNFQVGDFVACAGAGYANHAEVNFVPKNLAVKIPKGVALEDAAYTTVGAIALQGVRQVEPKLGDVVFVMGLGLLGLITIQLLKASGCIVIGSDLNPNRLKLANKLGIDRALLVDKDNIIDETEKLTDGHGADAVIIAASTKSNAPIESSAQLTRRKGKVIALGMISLNVPRNDFYLKELDLRLSMSYGPGRYDPIYEDRGQDYPYEFVRWTERRNMQAILNLMQREILDVKSLTNQRSKFEDAQEVYKNLIEGKEESIGILFTYAETKRDSLQPKAYKLQKKTEERKIRLGLIGAGNYAGGILYPHLKNFSDVEIIGVATAVGAEADKTAKKLKARIVTTDYNEFLKNNDINTVIIATRHNLHAEQIIASIKANKHVFVEKPLALSVKELEEIKKVYVKNNRVLFVGYNRRFSPITKKAKELFEGRKDPLNIIYRVNAGFIPKSHWVQDPGEGGGRVIGEMCHFIDFFIYLTDSKPVQVYTTASSVSREEQVLEDNISIVLRFSDGSVATLIYTANGDMALEKEYIEVFGDGKSAVINDFKHLDLYSESKKRKVKLSSQDKGQVGELRDFFDTVLGKPEHGIDFEDLYATSFTTFKILESLRTGQPVGISF